MAGDVADGRAVEWAALRNQVAELGRSLGLEASIEVEVGRRIWGARRRIDVVLRHPETGMDRGMDQNDTGIGLTQPLLCSFTTMRRAIVHDPEQAFPGSIRFLSQYLMLDSAKF